MPSLLVHVFLKSEDEGIELNNHCGATHTHKNTYSPKDCLISLLISVLSKYN